MKKLIQMLMLCVMAIVIAVPAFARLNSEHATALVQDDDAKAALYAKVTENITKNQQIAYEAAKEYLTKWPNDTDQIATYLKDFVAKYEKAMAKQNCTKLLGEKKWAEAYPLCKALATEQPDDLAANLNVSWAGLQLALSGSNVNNAEAMTYATKTIQMIESGKTLEAGKPYADKDKQEALGWLNYSLYLYALKNNMPTEAANYLIKALQYESPFKTNPDMYLKLASIYEADYEKKRQDFAAKYPDNTVKTPESEAALEQVKQTLDLVIDAIARVIAYSGTDPATQKARDDLKKNLADYYKYRHGSVDGLDALIAGIKTKPLPLPKQGVAAAPTPATTSAPATGATTAESTTTPATTTPATTTPATTTPATTTPATTTPATTTPATSTTTKPSTAGGGTTPEKKPATAPMGNNGRFPRK